MWPAVEWRSPTPAGARHSTTRVEALYLGPGGRLAFDPRSRGEVHRIIRQWLRVARTPAEVRRVMRVWREIHYLAKPERGPTYDPIGARCIRLHYYLDLPCLRPAPEPWIPAAAVTIRFALPGGVPDWLGLESPLQALEVARMFAADDVRQMVRDFSPAVLREVVRRIREGRDWAEVVRGRVRWQPRWLLTWADPSVGHDGGLYRGAGAVYLGESAGGKLLFGWPLCREHASVAGS